MARHRFARVNAEPLPNYFFQIYFNLVEGEKVLKICHTKSYFYRVIFTMWHIRVNEQ